jgi:hypothetical protein
MPPYRNSLTQLAGCIPRTGANRGGMRAVKAVLMRVRGLNVSNGTCAPPGGGIRVSPVGERWDKGTRLAPTALFPVAWVGSIGGMA